MTFGSKLLRRHALATQVSHDRLCTRLRQLLIMCPRTRRIRVADYHNAPEAHALIRTHKFVETRFRRAGNNYTYRAAKPRAQEDPMMSTHESAEVLLAWFRERSRATVSEIVASGLKKSCTASDAVQYPLRNGALERIVRSGASAKERVHYRATGIALPAPRTQAAQPSFDGLLTAWGIVLEPPRLLSTGSRTRQISDNG